MAVVARPSDVLPRHFAGGEWKFKQIAKKGKRSWTASKPCRLYTAIPPAEGWPGGPPEKNGWKPGGGK